MQKARMIINPKARYYFTILDTENIQWIDFKLQDFDGVVLNEMICKSLRVDVTWSQWSDKASRNDGIVTLGPPTP